MNSDDFWGSYLADRHRLSSELYAAELSSEMKRRGAHHHRCPCRTCIPGPWPAPVREGNPT